MNTNTRKWNFGKLVSVIRQVHEELAAQAGRAINISLTLRNWAIGCYIREYEQNGADRAEYGAQLLEYLGQELQKTLDNAYTARYLRLCRQLYTTYPHIRKSLISKFGPLGKGKSPISELPGIPVTEESGIVGTLSPQLLISGDQLVERLSFTHLVELIKLEDPLKRSFYEIECIRGNWSVRELKRQIGSLYYERSGLSKDKKKLAALAQESAETAEPRLAIRDPYVFEFLGLKPREVMSESHLEDQLLDKLQDFLLELGHGFCFEARQKRILIGDAHNFVDLVFYHRVLKCHVLVELKLEQFSHENIGQLNTYVSWYKKNMMTEGDNPPIGILLCTQRDRTLAEYALAGMDNGLFVSKYQLELPKKEDMQRFIEEQIRETGS
ncbi:MAG: PDDEXK nuclease domain-containing protein [Desulfobacterales bacterium]